MSGMQFGIFTVGDVTPDPTTGIAPTEADRIRATVTIAKKVEEVGLDVFATGEHHNPPFVPSSPTTLLGYIAAQTERIILSTATTLITTNDPVKIAEDFSVLQHLSGGRTDVMLGRGNTGPVYPWFGQDIRAAIPLTVEHYDLLRRLWREEVVDWTGEFRTPLQGFTLAPRAAGRQSRRSCGTASIRTPEVAELAALLRRRLLRQPHLLAVLAHQADGAVLPAAVRALRARQRAIRPSSASAGRSSCGPTARTR